MIRTWDEWVSPTPGSPTKSTWMSVLCDDTSVFKWSFCSSRELPATSESMIASLTKLMPWIWGPTSSRILSRPFNGLVLCCIQNCLKHATASDVTCKDMWIHFVTKNPKSMIWHESNIASACKLHCHAALKDVMWLMGRSRAWPVDKSSHASQQLMKAISCQLCAPVCHINVYLCYDSIFQDIAALLQNETLLCCTQKLNSWYLKMQGDFKIFKSRRYNVDVGVKAWLARSVRLLDLSCLISYWWIMTCKFSSCVSAFTIT